MLVIAAHTSSRIARWPGRPPTLGVRRSPGSDRCSAPLLGRAVAQSLGEFPPVTAGVLEDARTLTVFVRRQLLDHTRTTAAGASEGRIDIGHAHLDQVCRDAPTWRDSIATDLRDDDGAVCSDTQLRAVRSPIRTRSPNPNAASSHAAAARTSG